MNLLKVLFIVVFGCATFQWIHADEALKVTKAWVRMMPPSERTTAAYLVIENNTDQPMVLQSASSDAVEIVEMHQMSRKDGMMKMGMARDIVVPAKGIFSFDEAGYHLMLINLKESLKKNAIIPIVLHFKDGQNIAFDAVVKEGQE